MTTLAQADADPSLLPWWRWEDAIWVCNDPTGKRKADDTIIQHAVTYLRNDDRSRLPLIQAAREIFESDGMERAEIEARILAGQSDDEIAERCNFPPEVVAVYESLFFFVRRYLSADDWLTRKVVGIAHFRGFQNDEVRQFWAWVAMHSGPVAVDYLVHALRDSVRTDKATLAAYVREGTSADSQLQGFVAINVIPSEAGKQWLIEFGNQALGMQEAPSKEQALRMLRSETVRCARTYLETGRLPDPPSRNPLRGALLAKRSRTLVASLFKSFRDPLGSPETHGRTTACTDRQDKSSASGEPQQSKSCQTDRSATSCNGEGREAGGHHPGCRLPGEHGGLDTAR